MNNKLTNESRLLLQKFVDESVKAMGDNTLLTNDAVNEVFIIRKTYTDGKRMKMLIYYSIPRVLLTRAIVYVTVRFMIDDAPCKSVVSVANQQSIQMHKQVLNETAMLEFTLTPERVHFGYKSEELYQLINYISERLLGVPTRIALSNYQQQLDDAINCVGHHMFNTISFRDMYSHSHEESMHVALRISNTLLLNDTNNEFIRDIKAERAGLLVYHRELTKLAKLAIQELQNNEKAFCKELIKLLARASHECEKYEDFLILAEFSSKLGTSDDWNL